MIVVLVVAGRIGEADAPVAAAVGEL